MSCHAEAVNQSPKCAKLDRGRVNFLPNILGEN